MKTVKQIIRLWANWKPTDHYVSPYQVSNYYWFACRLCFAKKPLFPDGEINDLAAVIAGSKPSCVFDVERDFSVMRSLDNKKVDSKLVKILIKMAQKKNIPIFITKNDDNGHTIYCAKDKETLEALIKAWKESDIKEIGKILGYTENSNKAFMDRNDECAKEVIKIAQSSGKSIKDIIKENGAEQKLIEKVFEECGPNKNIFEHYPEFSIDATWFEAKI